MSNVYCVNMDKVIEVSHVSKHYGKVEALHDVSFSVHKGEVFGLIGLVLARPRFSASLPRCCCLRREECQWMAMM